MSSLPTMLLKLPIKTKPLQSFVPLLLYLDGKSWEHQIPINTQVTENNASFSSSYLCAILSEARLMWHIEHFIFRHIPIYIYLHSNKEQKLSKLWSKQDFIILLWSIICMFEQQNPAWWIINAAMVPWHIYGPKWQQEETLLNIWIPKPLYTPCPPTQMLSFFLSTEAFSRGKWCLCKWACGNHVYAIRTNEWFPPPRCVPNLVSGNFLKHLCSHILYTSSCEFHLMAENVGVQELDVQ